MTQVTTLSPDKILQLGSAFWGSKTHLSAVEFGVFTRLAESGPLDLAQVRNAVGFHERSARDSPSHATIGGTSAVAGGNGAHLFGQHPQGFPALHKQEVILVQGADRHVLQNDAVVGVNRENGIAA
jgi:hypothetical protein